MIARLTFKQEDPWSHRTVYDNCKHYIGPYFMRSGVRYTGLNGQQNDEDRERLERELGVDLKPQSHYWDTFAVILTDIDVIVNTDDPEGELKYKFLKNHKDVAFGIGDRKPSTTYVLLQEEEEAKEQNVKARIKLRAMSEFSKMSVNEMRQALRLFGYNSSNASPELVENNLFKLVEENPNKFLSLWVDNKSKETQFLIEEAVAKGILRKQQTTYKYGSDILGYSLENTVDYLNNPANQDLKVSLVAQLEGKDVSFGDKKPKKEESTSQFTKLQKEIEKEETKKNK